MTRPQEAISTYLDARRSEVAESTIRSHKSRLGQFGGWFEQQDDIEIMADLSPLDLTQYRSWRREDGDLSPASEKTQMDTLRVFIRWCEKMQIVEENLSNAVESPTLSSDENSRDEYVSEDEADIILDQLDRFKYASRDHVVTTLLWNTGLRTCSIRSLDLGDVNIDEELLELRHRPDQGTSLKNQYASERMVAIKPTTAAILGDYIEHTRVDQCDEFGRDPLITTTKNGRVGSSVIRKHSYGLTRPCKQGLECPHDRDPDSCDAAQCKSDAYGCPSSKSPHTWRRGHITHLLANGVPPEIVSGRADVTPEVIEDHYDSRDERTRVEQRRGYLNNI